MNNQKTVLNVQSEIGKLEAVLLHYPGAEVENMTVIYRKTYMGNA